jgi:BirA family biotin operon repressor/biotin-[acetyl-CoA-carboxylase] ligase
MEQPSMERSPLNQKLIEELVKKGPAGVSEILVLPETQSTNQYAIDLLAQGKSNFAVVSDFQSQGKGRLGRIWEAPAQSSILLSVSMKLNGVNNFGWLNLWAALVVKRILGESASFEIKLKWPNDLVVVDDDGFLKFGGILSQIHEDNVIFGIGINYSQDKSELPIETATSLKLIGFTQHAREDLIAELITGIFTSWQIEASSSEFPTSATVREYQQASYSLNKTVTVDLPSGERITGEAVGLAANGALLVRASDGTTHTVTAGDVI